MGLKTRILFVCLGNICRSPAGEGAFRSLLQKKNLASRFDVDSCGTASYHVGDLADPRTRKVAKSRGIELTHKARQFSTSDFLHFDYILAMDTSNYESIIALARTLEEKNKVHLFRKYDPLAKGNPSVPDPYYGREEDFIEVQDIVERASAGFLEFLLSDSRSNSL